MKPLQLTIAFCFILFISAKAQQPGQFSFAHYGTVNGLSSYDITQVLQDKSGFIWIGSVNGLQRFDGSRFLTFRHQEGQPGSLPENHIQEIEYDSNGNLWILFVNGTVGIFDTRSFVFQEVQVRVSQPIFLKIEKRLFTDYEGNVFYVVCGYETLSYNKRTNEFSTEANFLQTPPKWKIWEIRQDKKTRNYYIGSDSGLVVYNRRTARVNSRMSNPEKDALITAFGNIRNIANFLVDQKHRLWFESWPLTDVAPSIYCFALDKKEIVLKQFYVLPVIKMYHEPRGFMEQKDGTIWLYGLNVFARFNDKEASFEPVYNGFINEQSIEFEMVKDLMEDREKNIWVASNNNGLFRFNPSRQYFMNVRQKDRHTNKPGDGGVMSFISDRNNTILMGAWGNGLYRYDSSFRNVPLRIKGLKEKNSMNIWGACRDNDGKTIWMGSQPGVGRYDPVSNEFKLFAQGILGQVTVRQIYQDRMGDLWLGTHSSGLMKWTRSRDSRSKDSIIHIDGIRDALIIKISADSSGRLWIGTALSGAYVIDPATNAIIDHFAVDGPADKKLLSDRVAAFCMYDDTTVIIGAGGMNIYNSNRHSIKSIKIPAGMSPDISDFQKDRNGYVWVSLNGSICRVNPKNGVFIQFDRSDGIANDHFTMASSTQLQDGRMVFGSTNQFIVFDPYKILQKDPLPSVMITDFIVRNKSLRLDSLLQLDKIELEPDENSLTIEFSGLSYVSSPIIKYKLDGMDKGWRRADNSNQAVYSYLPAGTYAFFVQSEDTEGNPSKNITQLTIKVKPQFWQTWWFGGILVFMLLGILIYIDKIRMQKIRATESIRNKIATSLTEDMSNSLTSINISSELAKTKVDADTERTKEYIHSISDTSHRMVQSLYDMVWSINPKHDSMEQTLDRMKEFTTQMNAQHGLEVVFDIEKKVTRLNLGMHKRYELLAIFKEALSNVARHAGAKHVYVRIQYRKPFVRLLILDDGTGFDLDLASLGRGINDMRRRAESVQAALRIESEINTGTSIKLKIKTD